jgi:hypothetical protein
MRFVPSAPWHAALQMLHDVAVERVQQADVWVLSDHTLAEGDVVTLEVAVGGIRRTVRVVDCEPVVTEGTLRQRLRLRVLRMPANGDPCVWEDGDAW